MKMNKVAFIKKSSIKLTITLLAFIISLSLIISTTYAWLVMSTNPAVNSIQVAIAGGKTIMFAPDICEIVDGKEVHYPGNFSDNLNISNNENYSYLRNIKFLTPVSTSDGLNWFFPEYDKYGKLKSFSEFTIDNNLSLANNSNQGSYAYFDFWVVSPGNDYDLRLSMDVDTNKGSYLIELPRIVKNKNEFSFEECGTIAASARVGILVNNDVVVDSNPISKYMNSDYYDNRYSSLLGVFNNKGETIDASNEYSYYVYEPNCDYHPNLSNYEGLYIDTKALTLIDGSISEGLPIENTMAQLKNESEDIDEVLQTAIINKTELTSEEAEEYFYRNFLQDNFDYYVKSGKFIKYKADLLNESNIFNKSGACEDVVITTIKKNVPQRIRMFVYIEGQDIDMQDISYLKTYGIALSLEFAGGTHEDQ